MCVGVTLGSDDLINIPACKANLLRSEGCSYDGATHEGDIGERAGGVEIHPSARRRVQTHSNEGGGGARTATHATTVHACKYCTHLGHLTSTGGCSQLEKLLQSDGGEKVKLFLLI